MLLGKARQGSARDGGALVDLGDGCLWALKHEREKKQKAGIPATIRGRLAVGLDARGAAMGSLALAAFAWVIWKMLPRTSPIVALGAALIVWITLAVAIWRVGNCTYTSLGAGDPS